MKIVIAGVGKLGDYLARLLVNENAEVTVIDLNTNGKESLINNEDVSFIEGNALDPTILLEAGISSADLLISVMQSDSENIICSLIGKELGVKNTIARIRTPEYNNSINIIQDTLGLSMYINPEQQTAMQLAQTLSIPRALDSTSFLKGRMDVVSFRLEENNKLIDLNIKKITHKLKNNIIICAIERDGEVIIPTGETVLKENDIIHVTGKKKDINMFLKYTKIISEKTKKVLIAGGSRIAIYLSKILIEMGMSVTIIDNNIDKCNEISNKIPDALVINGNASDQNILYEEGIKTCDAFLALTGMDEENIVYSMFASSLGVPKVITKVNHINLEGIEKEANIDTIVASHKIAANQVFQYIMALEQGENSPCEAIYNFRDIFEIIEFKVTEDFKGLNIPISQLNLEDNFLVGAIQRGKSILYPDGSNVIKKGDKVLIVSKKGALRKLNDMVK